VDGYSHTGVCCVTINIRTCGNSLGSHTNNLIFWRKDMNLQDNVQENTVAPITKAAGIGGSLLILGGLVYIAKRMKDKADEKAILQAQALRGTTPVAPVQAPVIGSAAAPIPGQVL
jgi:hypothetical protein